MLLRQRHGDPTRSGSYIICASRKDEVCYVVLARVLELMQATCKSESTESNPLIATIMSHGLNIILEAFLLNWSTLTALVAHQQGQTNVQGFTVMLRNATVAS